MNFKLAVFVTYIFAMLAFAPLGRNTIAFTNDKATYNVNNITQANSGVEDDFSPGLALFAVIALCIVLVLVGAGIALVVAALFAIFILVTLGITSASVLTGLYKQSFTAGFKVFLLLAFGTGGIAFGALSITVANKVLHLHITTTIALLAGAVSGLTGGLILGFVAAAVFKKLSAYFKAKLIYTDV